VATRRYLLAFVLGALVTFGLFWVMQALIAVEAKLDPERKGLNIDFVRLKHESEPEKKKRELPEKQQHEDEPPPPDMNFARNLRPDAGGEGYGPSFDSDINMNGGTGLGGLGAADQDVVPLVRVNPEYPIRAAQRGIEGWVEVAFSISPTGTVKDAEVIGYYPSSVFNNAALRAIRRWKYNPKIENGKPVERPGMTVRLTFQLQK
jgi:periplasmic protein TonB